MNGEDGKDEAQYMGHAKEAEEGDVMSDVNKGDREDDEDPRELGNTIEISSRAIHLTKWQIIRLPIHKIK